MTRARRSALLSTPLAAISIAMLTALGCGGGGGAGPAVDAGSDTKADGNAGSTGSAGRGGTTGSGGGGAGGSAAGTTGTGGGGTTGTAGRGGTGGSTAGTTGTGGGGTGGSAAGTTGTGGGGTTGTAGTGGSAAGTTGTGGGGTGGSAAGTTGTAGTGGSAAGTTGTGGGGTTGTAGAGGTGGSGPSCTNGTSCPLSGSIKGVCTNGTCSACVPPDDTACATAYGAGNICVAGNCVMGTCHNNNECNGKICDATFTCASCTTVASCAAYGTGYICQTSTGKCIQGACNTNADCGGTGQICNGSNQCVSCGTSDTACQTAYTSGYICVSGNCVTGTCHTGSECASTQQNCSAQSHTCVDCTDDNSCQTSYGASNYLCIVGTPNKCVQGTCRVNGDCSGGQICVGNACVNCTTDASCGAGQLCLNSGCTTGNCRVANDCVTAGMSGKVCTTNNCAPCGSDGDCQSGSTGYGAGYLCQGGVCVAGDCRSTNGASTPTCAASQLICSSLTCSACSTDAQCADAANYGPNHICLGNACISGNCHSTTGPAPCSNGQICDLATTHSCVGCSTDAQCQDVANYGAGNYCQNSACTAGQCRVSTDCSGGNAGKLCNGSLACVACTTNASCTSDPSYGANHVCVGGACLAGSCATSADCTGTDQICDTTTHACVACTTDAACAGDVAYGAMHICLKDSNGVNGKCLPGDCHDTSAECSGGQICGIGTAHTCGACGSDTVCKSDSTYGSTAICLNPGASGSCVTGDCHDTSTECTFGKICGVSTAHTCGSCGAGATGDNQCKADGRYGASDICFQGNCGPGNCHAVSSDCTGANSGLICGVSVTDTCGTCTSDGQCKSDTFYGNSDICNTSTGANQGKCVTAACAVNSTTCAANSADFCCGNLCVAGNCCNDTDCVNNGSFGVGWACKSNSCSKCDGASGNKYFVDPVNGNDQTATGSGLSGGAATPSCSFKTLTRAFAVIGNFGAPNTKVILVGVSGQTRGLFTGAGGDVLPLIVPPNVIVSTTTGPITITLATTAVGNPAGFRLNNAGSGIAGDPSGPLTLDGNNHNAGIAVVVAPGAGNSVTMSNVTIQNTLGHGINVTSGTLNIGAGVAVSGAGIVGTARDGILVSGGMANITVPAGQTQTSFNNNTSHGIEVSGLGSVNVTGVPSGAPSSNGTVIANGNTTAGIRINQTVGGAGLQTNTINGLVAWANQNYGARVFGGSRVKMRNGVYGTNAVDGILVSNGSGTAAGNDLTNIDLGIMGDPGLNWLQTPLGSLGTNLTAGLCVGMSNAMGALTLNARGNFFVTTALAQINCSTTVGTITKAATCQNHNSVGGSTAAAGTNVTIDVTTCN